MSLISSSSSSSSSSSWVTPPDSPTLLSDSDFETEVQSEHTEKKLRTSFESSHVRTLSDDLFNQYLGVLERFKRRGGSELKPHEVSSLVSLSRSYRELSSATPRDQITLCEIGLYLARHFTSKIKTDPEHAHSHTENAKKYHTLGTQRFGTGKYDLRGDACWNAGFFYEKQAKDAEPSRKRALLTEALAYYKKAAKSTLEYTEESHDYSCYSDVSRVFSKLAELTEDPIERAAFTEKATANKTLAKRQKADQGRLQTLSRRQLNHANNLDIRAGRLLTEIASQEHSITQAQLKECNHILAFEPSFFCHTDPVKTLNYLKRRGELALAVGHYYENRLCNKGRPYSIAELSADKAIKYFKIAQNPYGVGKYDVPAEAFRGQARVLMWLTAKKITPPTTLLREVAACYEKAGKASAPMSAEQGALDDYQAAKSVYRRIALIEPGNHLAMQKEGNLQFLIQLKTAQIAEREMNRGGMPLGALKICAEEALEEYESLGSCHHAFRGKARIYEALSKQVFDERQEEYLLNAATAYLQAAATTPQGVIKYEARILEDLASAALHFSDLLVKTKETSPYLNHALANGKKALGIEGEISEELLDSLTTEFLLPYQKQALMALKSCLKFMDVPTPAIAVSPASSSSSSSSSMSSDETSSLPPKMRFKRLAADSLAAGSSV